MKQLAIGAMILLAVTQSNAAVSEYNVLINAAQEIPAPTGVPTGAAGFAMVAYDDATGELSWDIAWQGLSGAPVGMHFHEGSAGATGGVAVNVGDISGLTSPTIGSSVVSADFASQLLAGNSYLNIHTPTNGPGEIRGQVSPNAVSATATLDTVQEVPTPVGVSDAAGGTANFAYDPDSGMLGWRIEWNDLTGPAVGMHIHGPAGVGETAGVIVDLGALSGLESPSIGATELSPELRDVILGGQSYINIHTAQNGPGEIRGQIVPEPASRSAFLLAAVGFVCGCRRRNRN